MSNELDQFLETPESDAVAAPEAEAETPQETGKVETNAETTAAVEKESTANPEQEHWTQAAYLDEKRKRQELERRLAEVEKPQAQEEDVDLFSDPDKYKKSVDEKISKATLTTKISLSREFLIDTKPDYAEKEAKFVEMAKQDSSLVAKMNASSNPAKYAYETAAKQMALDEIGDPLSYREKLKQEILAELGKEKPAEAPAKPTIEKTPSLATATAAKSNTEFHDPSLEELFAR